MKEEEIIKIFNNLIDLIRTENIKTAKNEFDKLFKVKDSEVTQKIIKKIYELGEVFNFANALYYFNRINDYLKNHNSYFLRLVRQEIVYNSEYFTFKELNQINQKDLEKYPSDPEFLHFRGLIFSDEKQYAIAQKNIDLALEIQPKNVNFIRNKALIFAEIEEYHEAEKLINYALGIEPDNEKLIGDKEYLESKQDYEEQENRFETIEKDIKSLHNSLSTAKYEFVGILGLFVAILTVVIKIVNIKHSEYIGLSFIEILRQEIALNLIWLIALLLIIVVLLIVVFKKSSLNK